VASADNRKNKQSKSGQPKGGQVRRGSTATASRSTKQDKAAKDGKPKSASRWSRSRDRARQQTKGGGQKSERGLRKFLKDVRVELRKVTWPTRKDLFQSTLVVLVAVAISGAFIAALDFIFSRLMNYLLP
jgi:preprotein translocase subunit SecE